MRTKTYLPFALGLALLSLAGCGGTTSGTPSFLATPSISSITPNPVTRGSTVTINGTNLNGTLTTAYFVTGATLTPSTASSGSTTSVTVTVPSSIAAGTYNVYVLVSDGLGDTSPQSNAVTVTLQ